MTAPYDTLALDPETWDLFVDSSGNTRAVDSSGADLAAASAFPANFGSLAIDTSGNVTIGGYATGQTPAESVWGNSDGNRTLTSLLLIVRAA